MFDFVCRFAHCQQVFAVQFLAGLDSLNTLLTLAHNIDTRRKRRENPGCQPVAPAVGQNQLFSFNFWMSTARY